MTPPSWIVARHDGDRWYITPRVLTEDDARAAAAEVDPVRHSVVLVDLDEAEKPANPADYSTEDLQFARMRIDEFLQARVPRGRTA